MTPLAAGGLNEAPDGLVLAACDAGDARHAELTERVGVEPREGFFEAHMGVSDAMEISRSWRGSSETRRPDETAVANDTERRGGPKPSPRRWGNRSSTNCFTTRRRHRRRDR